MQAKHYYECHITIDPVFDEKLEELKAIAKQNNFKVAELLMKVRAEDTEVRSANDTFMTSHNKDLAWIKINLINLCEDLKDNGFVVRRYKIEDIVLDSRIDDKLRLLPS